MMGPLDHTWVYVNEMTQDKSWSSEIPAMWSECWSFALVHPPWERELDWGLSSMTRSLIDQLCWSDETLTLSLGTKAQLSFRAAEHVDVPAGWCVLIPQDRAWKFHVQDPSRPFPVCAFVWLVLICNLYNRTAILSIVLSWILWIILANYRTWGVVGTTEFVNQFVRSVSGLRTPELAAGVWGCWGMWP